MDVDNLKKAIEGIDDAYLEIMRTPALKDELKRCLGAINEDVEDNPAMLTPAPHRIFEAFKLCRWEDLKVIILGQDPYPTKGNAHGLSFSVEHGIKPPASLKRIYECLLCQGLIALMPSHGNLTKWAEQGVLMLNASLTTRVGKSNAHANIWKEYTSMLLEAICQKKEGIIIIAWGSSAQAKAPRGGNVHYLSWGHPSPLSTYNQSDNEKNFKYCDNFAKCNEILKELGKPQIDWNP